MTTLRKRIVWEISRLKQERIKIRKQWTAVNRDIKQLDGREERLRLALAALDAEIDAAEARLRDI